MPLNDIEQVKLNDEAHKGRRHEEVWEQYIKPFFDSKEAQLYQAFVETPTANPEMLSTIKMQHNALRGLEAHFKEFIETGKMAQITLNEEESNE